MRLAPPNRVPRPLTSIQELGVYVLSLFANRIYNYCKRYTSDGRLSTAMTNSLETIRVVGGPIRDLTRAAAGPRQVAGRAWEFDQEMTAAA